MGVEAQCWLEWSMRKPRVLESSISWYGWWLQRCILSLKFIDLCLLLCIIIFQIGRPGGGEGGRKKEETDRQTPWECQSMAQPETLPVVFETNTKYVTLSRQPVLKLPRLKGGVCASSLVMICFSFKLFICVWHIPARCQLENKKSQSRVKMSG